jgi:FkbM family methyltransferase
MERGSSKRLWRKVMIVLFLLGIAAATASTPGFPWRTHLVSLKFQGLLPQTRWSDLLVRSIPQEGLEQGWSDSVTYVGPIVWDKEPCQVLWRTSMGDFWGRDSDQPTLSIVVNEQHKRKVYERGPVAIRAGDVVFDGGSHLGAFTRFALQHGAGLVVAFEPEPTNIACYKRTFEREIAAGRVILVEAALWEKPGTLDFTTGVHSAAGQVHPATGNPSAQIVPATTIDETVARLKLDRLDFIKLDSEG